MSAKIEIQTLNGHALKDTAARETAAKNAEEIVKLFDEIDDKQPKGEYLTEHQKLKTINGQSLAGEGDITIEGSQSNGLTSTVKRLLLTILENAAYVTDQSNNLSLLKDALGDAQSDDTSGDIPGEGGSDEGGSDESGADVEQYGSTLKIRSVTTVAQNGSTLFLT